MDRHPRQRERSAVPAERRLAELARSEAKHYIKLSLSALDFS